MLSHDDLAVIHKTETKTIVGRNGGKLTFQSLMDGCSKFGKMGIHEQDDCDF